MTALLTVAALTTLGTVAASPAQASASVSGCAPGVGKRVPVEFVHGFLGKPSAWTSMQAALEHVNNLYLDKPFDYSKEDTQWVADPAIGPALALRIECLATSSRKAGGSGKVILIVHSMGGLAAHWAAGDSADAAAVADDLGLVVTIATPTRPASTAPTPNGPARSAARP
jgi:triacylglycerol esterase/lipase EstA (alpha/beta hydrolase family)